LGLVATSTGFSWRGCDAIRSSHPLVALAFVAAVAGFAIALWSNYDRATQWTRLPVLGTVLSLGQDAEHGEDDD